jgi:hypothetical protein
MNDSNWIRAMVRRGICDGHGATQIFNEIFRLIYGTNNFFYHSSMVDKWLKNVDNESAANQLVGFFFLAKIRKI